MALWNSKKYIILKINYNYFLLFQKWISKTEAKRGKKISTKELKEEVFFKEKTDLKIILIGYSAIGESK